VTSVLPTRAWHELSDFVPPAAGCAFAVGVFDGVHRGHQVLIDTVTREARLRGLLPAALTFDPHPAACFRPDLAPFLITEIDERAHWLHHYGIEQTIVATFDRAFASITPDAFVHDVLAQQLGARLVVVGPDFSFGVKRSGTREDLVRLGDDAGIDIFVLDEQRAGGMQWRSTSIRSLIQGGKVAGAAEVLGHPVVLAGTVVQGMARGRKLGFPTANLRLSEYQIAPKNGVYACRVATDSGTWTPAIMNIGLAPTFSDRDRDSHRPVPEVHLLDQPADTDLYGQRLRVALVERIRGERRFRDSEALIERIAVDVALARRMLGA
jgi:riboflavin kinase / FMN adenylyltransferase